MGIVERLDEVDYRLHLRERPGTPGPPLTGRRLWLLRIVLCLTLLYIPVALAVGLAIGAWAPIIPAVGVVFISWASYDAETRRRILPAAWSRRSRRHGGQD